MRYRDADPYRTNGFSLVEALIVAVLLSMVLAFAMPPLLGWVRLLQARGLAERLVSDIHAARMLAVGRGGRTELRFTPAEPGPCIAGYTVVAMGPPEQVVRSVVLEAGSGAPCLTSNLLVPLRFSSRGLPRGVVGRTLEVRRGDRSDSIVVSALGRVRRSYRRQKASRKKMPVPAVPASRRGGRPGGKPPECWSSRRAHNFPLRPGTATHGRPDARLARRSRPASNRGFSMVEVLVALVVLALGGVAVHGAMVAALGQVAHGGVESRMAGVAMEVAETALLQARWGAMPPDGCPAIESRGRLEVRCEATTSDDDGALTPGVVRVAVEVRVTGEWQGRGTPPRIEYVGVTRR